MTDRHRRIAFGGAAALLAGSVLVLTLLAPAMRSSGTGHPKRPAGTSEIRTGPRRVPASGEEPARRENMRSSTPVSQTPASSAGSTSREREPRGAPAVEPRQARAAVTSARRFLDGYLPYSYGRLQASRIRAAALALMRELKRSPPRVPVAVARADPRLVSVHAEATLGDRAIGVLAVVVDDDDDDDDDRRRYTVALELRQTGGHWVVTAIGG